MTLTPTDEAMQKYKDNTPNQLRNWQVRSL